MKFVRDVFILEDLTKSVKLRAYVASSGHVFNTISMASTFPKVKKAPLEEVVNVHLHVTQTESYEANITV